MKQKHSTWPKLRTALAIISFVFFIAFLVRYSFDYSVPPFAEISFRWSIMATACLLGLMAGLVSYYEYRGFGNQEGITRRFNKGPLVALTFDDGPSPRYTPLILDILKEYGVKATFFVTGKHVNKYPEILKRIVAEGHDVGNHTYNHRDLVPATKATILKEITKTEQALMDTAGITTDLFRPPRGIYNQTVRKLVVDKNYKIILWSLSTCDWRGITASGILKRVKRYVKDGSIILYHDSGAVMRKEGGSRGSTVRSLPFVIEYLLEEDYEILPVSEILAVIDKEPEIEPAEV